MKDNQSPIRLFEAIGVELEYMIVQKANLKVNPIADKLFFDATGNYDSDYENGEVAWSNELVLHVLELKTNGPRASLKGLDKAFLQNIIEINNRLEPYGSKLLGTAAHPLMDPLTETKIWPHDHHEIYAKYNEIFDCRGHGWANLQSTHINLPFAGDEEFGRLHAAIRLLLPIIPALSASSPVLDGKISGLKDTRLSYYRKNQAKIPSLTGMVIPERVFTKDEYHQQIFNRIKNDILPKDPTGILDPFFLNSRGAIARFERGAIEIRIIDIQECPKADIAIINLLVFALKELVNETYISLNEQQQWTEQDLSEMFIPAITSGEETIISNEKYLNAFGKKAKSCSLKELWQDIIDRYTKEEAEDNREITSDFINAWTKHGSLSTRIVKAIGSEPSPAIIKETFERLATCLTENKIFTP